MVTPGAEVMRILPERIRRRAEARRPITDSQRAAHPKTTRRAHRTRFLSPWERCSTYGNARRALAAPGERWAQGPNSATSWSKAHRKGAQRAVEWHDEQPAASPVFLVGRLPQTGR